MTRRLVHISMIAFSMAIGRIPAWAISLCCLAALIFNGFILPHISSRSLQKDRNAHLDLGLLWYPASLLIISLIFQHSLIFMVIAWGAMAFGDAAAGILGGGKSVIWNKEKTWSGSFAFFIVGSLLTIGLITLVPDHLFLGQNFQHWTTVILIALTIGMLIESVPDLIDDNVSVPFGVSIAAWISHQVLTHSILLPEHSLIGASGVVLLMVGAVLSKKIDVPGAIIGGLLTWLLWAGCGWLGIGLIASLFVLGSLASRWSEHVSNRTAKHSNNQAAEVHEEVRGIPNVLANGLVAGLAGLLAWIQPDASIMWTAVAAASLAAATSDTLASELGTLYGKRFAHVYHFTAMRRGEDGAISLEGSLAGMLGASFVALLFGLGTGDWILAVWVGFAGLFGNWLDSVLGVSLQRKGLLNNHTVNVLCTIGAAGVMLLFLAW